MQATRGSDHRPMPPPPRCGGALALALWACLGALSGQRPAGAAHGQPAPLPPAAGARLSAEELGRLAAGAVVTRLEPTPGGGPRTGFGAATIAAPVERVFAALADLAHWSEFMPFMRRSEARREADGSWLCRQSLTLPVGERHYSILAQASIPAKAAILAQARGAGGGVSGTGSGEAAVWRLTWSYVPGSGNIAAQRGSWTLLPAGAGRTLAVLRLASDPGGVAAWLADRAAARSLPWIFDGLRQQVGRDRYAAAAAAPAGERP